MRSATVTVRNFGQRGVGECVDHERAAPGEHATQLADDGWQVADVLEHLAGNDHRRDPVGERQPRGVTRTGVTPCSRATEHRR